jgi:hypothetical protein
LLFYLFIQQLAKTDIFFFPLEVADVGGIVPELLRARQSLYPQIAVHALFLMFFGVSRYILHHG